MTHIARNLTMADVGVLADHRYLIHDRDGKYCPAFDEAVREVARGRCDCAHAARI